MALPPRLRNKYLQEHGMLPPQNSSLGTTSEDSWDGSTVTFQVRYFVSRLKLIEFA